MARYNHTRQLAHQATYTGPLGKPSIFSKRFLSPNLVHFQVHRLTFCLNSANVISLPMPWELATSGPRRGETVILAGLTGPTGLACGVSPLRNGSSERGPARGPDHRGPFLRVQRLRVSCFSPRYGVPIPSPPSPSGAGVENKS